MDSPFSPAHDKDIIAVIFISERTGDDARGYAKAADAMVRLVAQTTRIYCWP